MDTLGDKNSERILKSNLFGSLVNLILILNVVVDFLYFFDDYAVKIDWSLNCLKINRSMYNDSQFL